MDNYLWLIVLFNAILGWFLVALVLRFIKKSISQNEKVIVSVIVEQIEVEFGSENPLAKEVESLDLATELGPLLDHRLAKITQKMASQIPMGEFILAGSLGQKMQLKIKEEIFQLLPELKELFVKRVSEEFDFKKILCEKIHQYDFKKLLVQLEERTTASFLKMKLAGALIGAVIGFLEVILIILLMKEG